jgi:hypothetical protein
VGREVICSGEKKPTTECGCKGLRCAIVVSSGEAQDDVVCHKPAIRHLGHDPNEGVCVECLNEMAQGGDFPLDKVDEMFPPVGSLQSVEMKK